MKRVPATKQLRIQGRSPKGKPPASWLEENLFHNVL
jgi:hypothetical protein